MNVRIIADEKHVDDLVKAVIKAKPLIPELSFSIYGEGKHRNPLLQLIKENNASDYIKLMGHHELTEIYRNHGVYVSASLSEGFGLSLLEALSNGLVFVGYDVDYGNAEFMIDGKNAIKIPYEKGHLQSEVLKNAILSLYGIEPDGTKKENHFDIESGMKVSYERSKAYTADKIKNSWEEILRD
ncbi:MULTISPECIES: glycosyltransferase [unclassified Enterococcus]|uniref:glycosyltransferase n=1 Tax=unclassified Enterococcus TaxID=2608891 RepID=UPI003D2BF2D0